MDLSNWSGYITVAPVDSIDELTVTPLLATPVTVQGISGTIGINFQPNQSATPLITPGLYHHWVTMTDPSGNIYYYLNGNFTWLSP